MNNKSIFSLVTAALLSLTIVNCSSDNNESKAQKSGAEINVVSFVSGERPNDFPNDSSSAEFDSESNVWIVTSHETGCRIQAAVEGASVIIASEVDCSQ